jgi:hypothetical protein
MLEAQQERDQSELPKKSNRQAERNFKKEILKSKREQQDHALRVLLAMIDYNDGVKGCHLISDVVKAFNHPAVTYHTLKYRLKCYRADPSKLKVSKGGLVCPKYVAVPVCSCAHDFRSMDSASDSEISTTYKHHNPSTGRKLISPAIPTNTTNSSPTTSSTTISSPSSMDIYIEKRILEERRKLELKFRLLCRKDMDLHQLNAVAIQHCDSPMK